MKLGVLTKRIVSMKYFLPGIFCAILVLFAGPDVQACSCDLPYPKLSLSQQVKKARKQSQAVFVGRVFDIVNPPGSYIVVVKFRVESVWRGKLAKEVSLTTGRGNGDCGYRFEVGQSYLVYAYGSDETDLATNICQRTAAISDATVDLKLLGKGKVPS